MVYPLKMVIFHGHVTNNQRVSGHKLLVHQNVIGFEVEMLIDLLMLIITQIVNIPGLTYSYLALGLSLFFF